jgi:hypothetical protein
MPEVRDDAGTDGGGVVTEPFLLDAGSRDDVVEVLDDLMAPDGGPAVAGPWIVAWAPGGRRSAGVPAGRPSRSLTVVRSGGTAVIAVERLPGDRSPADFLAECESAAEADGVRLVVLVIDRPHGVGRLIPDQ